MKTRQTVLVIDDDEQSLLTVKRLIQKMGVSVLTASDGITGMFLLRTEKPDLVVTDLEMPVMTGIEVLHETKSIAPDVMVIIMTGYASVETAVDAMRAGAIDYIQKPINYDYFKIVINKALERRRLISENLNLKTKLDERYKFNNIIGRSAAMRKIFSTIEKVAPTNANVLIWGESGTGKEMIAHSIHTYSTRVKKAFVAVDCVSLPAHLIESELFGYEKGAFTGANTSRSGLLELAHEGTFFMDEITELDYDLQAKLLRTLQERQFRRVGGRKLIDVDIRIISATKRNPEDAVKDNQFREDLFYRLNVIPIHIPPLRERPEDIPLLINHFLETQQNGENIATSIEPDAIDMLQSYKWAGNVRELKNMIERLSIMANGDCITVNDLPTFIMMGIGSNNRDAWMTSLPFKEAKRKWVNRFEQKYVEQMLEKYNGNITQAARFSGINRRTYHRIMDKLGIARQREIDL